MRLTNVLSPVVTCFIALFAVVASAEDPQTVKDLLGKGGKQLSKDELVSLVSGATMSGTQINFPDRKFELEYKSNGEVRGTGRSGSEPVRSLTGKWSVNEEAGLCVELWNDLGQRLTSGRCLSYFVLDDAYFAAARDGRLDRRTFKR